MMFKRWRCAWLYTRGHVGGNAPLLQNLRYTEISGDPILRAPTQRYTLTSSQREALFNYIVSQDPEEDHDIDTIETAIYRWAGCVLPDGTEIRSADITRANATRSASYICYEYL